MPVAETIPYHSGNLDWLLTDLSPRFPWDPVEAIADFDLLPAAERSKDRPVRPAWRAYDRNRNEVPTPSVLYYPHDYASLEELFRAIGRHPLYHVTRRVHFCGDGIFLADLADGMPGPWTFIHDQTLSAHEVLERIARFERRHGHLPGDTK